VTDLRTTYLGLGLRSPLAASAAPLTGHVDSLLALEEDGAAAVVLPSLFEEEVDGDSLLLHEQLETGSLSFPEATGFFPTLEFGDIGPEGHVKLVMAAKDQLRIPVLASVNGTTPGGCVRYARVMADAGADAIELNHYAVAADASRSGADVGAGYLDVVRRVRAAIEVPLAVKLSPLLLLHRALRPPRRRGRCGRAGPVQPLLPAGHRPRHAGRASEGRALGSAGVAASAALDRDPPAAAARHHARRDDRRALRFGCREGTTRRRRRGDDDLRAVAARLGVPSTPDRHASEGIRRGIWRGRWTRVTVPPGPRVARRFHFAR